MKSDEARNIVVELSDHLKTVIYTRDLPFATLRLVFLKYVVDNSFGAATMEDMQLFSRAQKMFAMRNLESGIDVIFELLQHLDKCFGFENIFIGSADRYARELFGMDSYSAKRSATPDRYKRLFEILSQLDFEESTELHETGQILVDAIIGLTDRYMLEKNYVRFATTHRSLSELTKALLDVRSEDVFCDFASGAGLSTLSITKDALPAIYNIERDIELSALSAMIYIMYGYKDIHVFSGDSLGNSFEDIKANKIFVDGPLGRMMESSDGQRRDYSVAIVDKAIHNYLSENGMAVLTVPSNFLFNGSAPIRDLRKELVLGGMLKAVLALPPLWNGTAITTNLLVISRSQHKIKDVLFINALDAVKYAGKYAPKSSVVFPADLISRICNLINEPDNLEGFSAISSVSEIEDKDFNLMPTSYITASKDKDSTSLSEIDDTLRNLYRQLQKDITLDNLRDFGIDTDAGIKKCQNNEAFYLKLVSLAVKDPNLTRLKEAFEKGDTKAAIESALLIRGSMDNLGVVSIYEAAKDIADDLRTGSILSDSTGQLETIIEGCDQIGRIMQGW